MNVVVFGAEGFTGRAVLANLKGRHEIRAASYSPETWEQWREEDGEWADSEIVYGDIVDFDTVHQATEGMDAIIHLAVYSGGGEGSYSVYDEKPFLVNLKGLWNVLESARQRGVRRVVHIGSCHTIHPKGIFFTSEVRRPDGSLYGVCKRLQEEMCRQFHDAFDLRIIVLRPDYIVDSRLGIGRHKEKLGSEGNRMRGGWVCRHDLAEACRLAIENEAADFDILHTVGSPEARETCNVERTQEVLGLEFLGDIDQYR